MSMLKGRCKFSRHCSWTLVNTLRYCGRCLKRSSVFEAKEPLLRINLFIKSSKLFHILYRESENLYLNSCISPLCRFHQVIPSPLVHFRR